MAATGAQPSADADFAKNEMEQKGFEP